MSLSKAISHRLLVGLENILLSFLDQLGTNAIKLELVNRLKTKENGYQFPLCTRLMLSIYGLALLLIVFSIGQKKQKMAALRVLVAIHNINIKFMMLTLISPRKRVCSVLSISFTRP
ncbi:hypothetical protein JB92DRAFT_3016840 [Gautieria morchelliformis]|nr:hypothetical protein JB92DRAFT_3016840 [Gautieria morchelliformis]